MKTSQSLLQRAKESPESEAWFKLVNVYDPLIAGWLRQCGIPDSDVADLTQEVLVTVVRGLPKFDHNGRTGAFRNWLRLIAVNRGKQYWSRRTKQPFVGSERHDEVMDQLADPKSAMSRKWDVEHERFVLSRILQLIRGEFNERTFEVFERNVIKGERAADIAREMDLPRGQIYKYKFRVMRRLQREAEGLLDPVHGIETLKTEEANEEDGRELDTTSKIVPESGVSR